MGFILKTFEKIMVFIQPKKFSFLYLIKIILLVILYGINANYFDFLQLDVFLQNTLNLVYYYLLLNLIFNSIRLLMTYIYLKKNRYKKDHYDNFILGISRLFFFLNHLIFILIAINLFVINVLELLTAISIIAAALAILFKDYIISFINGLIIMFSKEIRLKDYVQIGEYRGRITNISFRVIEMKTDHGDYMYLPNNIVFTDEIINFSKGSSKNVRIELNLENSYKKSYEKIKGEIKQKTFENFSEVVNSINEINIRINKIEKDYFNIIIELEVTKYNYKIELKIKDFINEYVISLYK